MMDFVLATRNCVSETRNCALKMMILTVSKLEGGDGEAPVGSPRDVNLLLKIEYFCTDE